MTTIAAVLIYLIAYGRGSRRDSAFLIGLFMIFIMDVITILVTLWISRGLL